MKFVHFSQTKETPVSHDPKIKKRVLLEEGLVPHLANFAQAEIPVGGYVSAHQHEDMWEVFWISSGHGLMTVDAEVFVINKGSCVVVAPTEIHLIKNIGKTKLVLRYFAITQ